MTGSTTPAPSCTRPAALDATRQTKSYTGYCRGLAGGAQHPRCTHIVGTRAAEPII